MKGTFLPLLLLAVASFLPGHSYGQTIRYVKQTANGSGNGLSWANASGNLQAMINASGTNDQVWVATGTYKPSTTDRTVSFAMKNNVTIYGGFPNTGNPNLTNRNLPLYPTTLSGDIDNSPTDNTGNSYHVISNPKGLTTTAVLDGFVVTGGNANGGDPSNADDPGNDGGGMYNNAKDRGDVCSPTVRNCSFVANSADRYGGAIHNHTGFSNGTSSPVLINCTFVANSAKRRGGAISNNGYGGTSSPILANCSFQNNSATNSDGVINTGGAIYNNGNNGGASSPVLTNCSFQNNTTSTFGGAISNEGQNAGNSSPMLINCSFQNNSAGRFGGGIYNNGYAGTSSPVLTNCSFQNNSAITSGGAIYNTGQSAGTSSPVLTNCVLFGNGTSNTIGNLLASVSATYSLFEFGVTGYSGSNNLITTVSPFINTTSTALNPCTAAIDAGSNAAYNAQTNPPFTDLAGNARFFNSGTGTPGRIDMGAYEFQGNSTTIALTNPTATTATAGVAFSQPFTATGGATPYSYSVMSGSLPTGLTLASTGLLSGTPTQTGSFLITVRATDANGCAGVSASYGLTVSQPAPTISGLAAMPNPVCVGSPVAINAILGNVSGSYSYTLTNGAATTMGTSTATAFNQNLTATGSGFQSFTLTVANTGGTASATGTYLVNQLPTISLSNNGPLSCTTTIVTLSALGPQLSTYAFSGPGLNQTGSSPMASVSQAGNYTVTVTAINTCSASTTTTVQSNTASVLVSSPPVTTATQGVSFSQSFTAVGGTGPYSFSIASGSLPMGLSMSTSGVLSGTPGESGSFPLTAQATDANGCFGISTPYTLTINVLPYDMVPTVYVRPSIVYNTKPIAVVASIYEINSVSTIGLITLRLSKDPVFTLSFDPTATSVGGRTVSNASWSFSQTDSYYQLSTSSVIAGSGVLSVGLSGTLTPGATNGSVTFSTIILGNSGGEIRVDNNSSAAKIDYFSAF